MLRNWVTQFGYASGRWAGDEGIPDEDRRKFIGQIGNYFGWNPPTMMNWMVEVAKDNSGKYVMVFMRYATDEEAERMLGKNYEIREAERRKNLGLAPMQHEDPYAQPHDTNISTEDSSCGISPLGGSACLPFDIKKGSIDNSKYEVRNSISHFNQAFSANAHRV